MVALDGDLVASLHEARLDAAANQRGRGAGFEAPLLHFAGGVPDVDEEPRMGILQSDFGDDAVHGHRLVGIEHRGKRMMGREPPGGDQEH